MNLGVIVAGMSAFSAAHAALAQEHEHQHQTHEQKEEEPAHGQEKGQMPMQQERAPRAPALARA